jgi:hypothetical protein
MNWPILISGLAAVSCTLGHFTVGSKQYLKPMLTASFDDVAKKVNHCVFHYVSAFLVLTAVALVLIGMGFTFNRDVSLLVKFIAIHYVVFALIQIIIAATSGIQNAIVKMFQWTFFVFIAVFAWIGAA